MSHACEYPRPKKKSLMDFPEDILFKIYNYIDTDDLISRINFLHLLLQDDEHSPMYKHELRLNCLMSQVYCVTDYMVDDVLYRIRHIECPAYVFMQWSPFSKQFARPIAKIWWSHTKPHRRVYFYNTQLRNGALRSISRGCYQARLSVHYDTEQHFYGYVKCSCRFKTYYFHPLPLLTCVADASQQCILSNGRFILPLR